MKTTHYFIERCLAFGRQGAEAGNSEVGALIAKGDTIISEAGEAVKTKKDISRHAEMEAMRQAVKALMTKMYLVVRYTQHTSHVLYAIRFYRIREVVYLEQSKYLGGVSSALPLLTTDQVPPGWSNAPTVNHVKEDSEDT